MLREVNEDIMSLIEAFKDNSIDEDIDNIIIALLNDAEEKQHEFNLDTFTQKKLNELFPKYGIDAWGVITGTIKTCFEYIQENKNGS